MSNKPCPDCGQEEIDCTCHCPFCHEYWERCACPPDPDLVVDNLVDEDLDGWEGE